MEPGKEVICVDGTPPSLKLGELYKVRSTNSINKDCDYCNLLLDVGVLADDSGAHGVHCDVCGAVKKIFARSSRRIFFSHKFFNYPDISELEQILNKEILTPPL